MKPTDWDRVLVADFSTERSRLGEADVMRLAWRPAADDARLRRDESAMFLVAQSNGLGGHATRPRLSRQDDRRGP
jgi:hypothetical protein